MKVTLIFVPGSGPIPFREYDLPEGLSPHQGLVVCDERLNFDFVVIKVLVVPETLRKHPDMPATQLNVHADNKHVLDVDLAKKCLANGWKEY